jgi:hypothetical protein
MRTSLKTPYLQLSSTTIGQQSNALFNPSHTKNVKEYNGLKKKYSGANLFENTLRQKKIVLMMHILVGSNPVEGRTKI